MKTRTSPLAAPACLLLGCLASFTAVLAQAPHWTVGSDSTLGFVATQEGSEFEGLFGEFDAQIRFAAGDLAGSRFLVTVTMDSVDTGNAERDQALRSADLFDAEQWPRARFEAGQFRHLEGDRYEAIGTLRIRDRSNPLTLPFEFDRQGDAATLAGSVTISRLDYGVGQGDWADTQWVGEDVTITYSLDLEHGS